MTKTQIIIVKGISITTFKVGKEDFISLSDIGLMQMKNHRNEHIYNLHNHLFQN